MKITDINPLKPSGVSPTKRKQGVSGANFMEYLSEADEAAATSDAAPVENIAATSFGSMLALQEMPEDELYRRKAIQRGNSALDQLESLRHSLLLGRVPAYLLRNISNLLADQKAQTPDPRLKEIIDEIEVRAAVELAKLEMAQLSQQRQQILSGEA